ncbi:MAG: adenosylmethionine--8-amino-7-oxononanoate transaminase [Asticcacaulis sp.]
MTAIWHPFTQHALMPEQIPVERTEGAYLYTADGRRIIDAISSWWVNVHGHNHPKIVAAVQDMAGRLDQVIFAGFTHAPAEELATRLIALTDPTLTRVFFSDSGSTAVEVALKMALGYFLHNGKPRSGIAAFDHAYHGETFGTMSVGGRSVFNAAYEPMLFDVHRLPFPEKGREHLTVEAFERLAKAGDLAALIVEPLVLGAGGMLMYGPETLRELHGIARRHGVLFIADEVMTGWGRTGTRFACDQAGIAPDIVCLSKGLTSGYLPLAVTLATEDIYRAFYSRDRAKTFFHSSSFTGNPLACAAANAALQIWDDEPVTARIAQIHDWQAEALTHFAARPDVTGARHTGTIMAFDIQVSDPGYLSQIGPKLYRFSLDQGVLLRPLGQTLYMLPPYCLTRDDLNAIVSTLDRALDAVRDGTLE